MYQRRRPAFPFYIPVISSSGQGTEGWDNRVVSVPESYTKSWDTALIWPGHKGANDRQDTEAEMWTLKRLVCVCTVVTGKHTHSEGLAPCQLDTNNHLHSYSTSLAPELYFYLLYTYKVSNTKWCIVRTLILCFYCMGSTFLNIKHVIDLVNVMQPWLSLELFAFQSLHILWKHKLSDRSSKHFFLFCR